MADLWEPGAAGVMALPSGRMVRGRGLSKPLPDGPLPDFGVYLLGRQPPPVVWSSRWIVWPDFRLPADRADALVALRDALERSATQRVEVACAGGRGRTGTALSILAVLDGVPPAEAVAYVRAGYSRHAVETPWQRRMIERLTV